MKAYRVTYNFDRFRPNKWAYDYSKLFGERNEGFVITGETAEKAFEAWNSARLPGNRWNPFYLKINEA